MDTEFNWPPLESDPQIFFDYMTKCGMPETWGFGEIYGFEDELLGMCAQPVLGVILNAEYTVRDKESGSADVKNEFYMKQTPVLDNACGVIACIHAVLNNKQVELKPDSALAKFRDQTATQTAQERAVFLENFKDFQEQHKVFASQGQSAQADNQEDVRHHFTVFIKNSAGQLVEMDGLKAGPHVIAEQCDDLLKGAVAEVQRRLAAGTITESLSCLTFGPAQ